MAGDANLLMHTTWHFIDLHLHVPARVVVHYHSRGSDHLMQLQLVGKFVPCVGRVVHQPS